ncbi:Endothelin-converting enzyme 1 [Ceratocystis lukuohia]|uniref:Endothelin-converting enzyme 1 n=1 Tax=Ceratocystis lukuohia TaxID=2019550 RepID=A0ABR4MME5_9PEZI
MRFSSVLAPGLLAHAISAQSEFASSKVDREAAPTSSPGYCNTPACQRIAADLRSNLASNYADLDPCSRFEELACGGWRLKHEPKLGEGKVATTTLIQDHIKGVMGEILEGPLPAGIDPSSQDAKNFYKMKAIYDACMDVDTIKGLGIQPLEKILAEMDGVRSFKEALLILLTNDVTGLVSIIPVFDAGDPEKLAVALTGPMDLGMPSPEDFESDEFLIQYYLTVKKVLPKLYPETTEGTIMELIRLETEIASLLPPPNERINPQKYYNTMTLEEANALLPPFAVADIINTLAPQGVPIERLIVHHPKYFSELPKILGSVRLETFKAYFRWRLITSYEPFLEHETLEPLKSFRNLFKTEESRQVHCINHVDNSVSNILSRFFVDKAFSPAAKDLATAMVANLKSVYTEKLQATEWMDEYSTERAVNKVLNMKEGIGYPTASPNITDPDELAHRYRDSVVGDKTHFDNEVSLRQMRWKEQWQALGKPADTDEWQSSPNEANANYVPPGNTLLLPAGLMQYPVFDVDVPAYVSYGAYGFVVGHEISHAFDSNGHFYDENGAFSKTSDWWTPNTEAAFSDRTQCFIDQFSSLVNEVSDGDVKIKNYVNGETSLNENIADTGGLSASFLAWKTLDDEGKGGAMLPGLEFFTRDQLFFLSFANFHCSKLLMPDGHVFDDSHSPGWARITGSLANNEDFLRAFNCPAKKPTCKIW